MPLSQFIEQHIEGDATKIGYLAQTQLFDQIPDLKRDIITPDYCSLGEFEEPIVNAWFGPAGTVSPCHHDPYHNLLAQVVGEKFIRLYNTDQTQFLYPHNDKMLWNTSQANVETPDPKFPLVEQAEFVECILQPGELLYIPPKFWHYVRSLSTSFSVSFWWE
eukprot:TRINITY_DN2547_c1_g1_i2.p1 TRINITY_DN2547_c1_g1~~TRINITY_DN2547_c1_g1_i2.p1  ORF type:complete len:162 (-),score=29.91 TRINITY_DN2547_c1_g1_i2:55-540(-)